ncbi:Uncharacterised protein [Mycobacteroides abscessus subsp. abscessus]|nr:Uncharacterised protein [Mycobacteroides abscessus subsp. abscessus]
MSIGSGRPDHSTSISRFSGVCPAGIFKEVRKIRPSPPFEGPFCVQYSSPFCSSTAIPTH